MLGLLHASCKKQDALAPSSEFDKTAYWMEVGEKQPRSFYVDGQLAGYIVPKELERMGFKSQVAADGWYKFEWHQKLMKDKPQPGIVYVWYEKEKCYKPALSNGG